MQTLPSLHFGDSCWQFPLCDASAIVLAEMLVRETSDELRDQLIDGLKQDPFLALWMICRAGENEVKFNDIPQMGDWFVPNALKILNWTDDPGESMSTSRKRREEWADRVGAAVVSAHSAGGGICLPRFYFGLDDWLSDCGSSITKEEILRGVSCIPAEFAQRVDKISRNKATDATAADRLASDRQALSARKRWLADIPGIGRCLMHLVQKLQRLKLLEEEFSSSLEREKLNSLKQFAYGAGHEINNPLANISTRAQTLLQDEHDPERRRKLATINSQAFRAHEMIADLMLFAKPPKLIRQSCDLTQLLTELVAELTPEATSKGIRIAFEASTDRLMASVDPDQIAVVIRALAMNAFEAIGPLGGRVAITVNRHSLADDGQVEVIIRDNGPGISDEVRRHLFNPFYSGREAGRGIGFGLSKCWRIVTDHGGTIFVDSQMDRGATFTMSLPVEMQDGINDF